MDASQRPLRFQRALDKLSDFADHYAAPFSWRDRRDWNLPPGPRGLPWIGPAGGPMRDPLVLLPRMREEFGDAFGFRAGNWWLNVVCHPDHVQRVLQDNQKNYNKATKGYNVLRVALGDGLLTAEGESWLRNRRLAQPAFHRQRIRALADRMTAAAGDVQTAWRSHAARGEVVDVADEMMDVTLRIVCETVLGTESGDLTERVGPAVTILLREANARINAVPELPVHWPLPSHLRIRRALATLDEVVDGIIAARRRRYDAGDGAGEDLLGLLMDAVDADSGGRMDDRQLRDEVMTMFLAGHETTAHLMAWTFMLLSSHPAVANDLRDEARAALGGAPATVADFDRLPLTEAVIQESLRLYPPAWIIGRAAIEDDEIGGFDVPAGTVVLTPAWVTHRHPDFWDNPEGFDPSRFLNAGPQHRWSYFPFGGGPRLCIGQGFALVEAKILLATLIQDVAADLVPGHIPIPEPLITLRPRYGLPMRLRSV